VDLISIALLLLVILTVLLAGGVWIGIDRGEAKLARMVANDSPSVGSSKPFAVSTHETS